MPWDSDFGTALRTLRGQASPDAVGIPVSLPRARRVPGLRREELAGRAGVSAEHLKRMEQGRRRPSPTVVDALAAALRLTTTEHGRLRALAGFAAVPPTGGRVPQEITPAARRMLDRLDDVPVCVCDAAWTALEGNDRWAAFARPLAQASGRDRNLVWRTFAKEAPDGLRTTEHLTAFQASLVADLRGAADRYPADPDLRALVQDLRGCSDVFEQLWSSPPPAGDRPDRVHFPDAAGGRASFDKDVLTLDPGDLRVVVFTESRGLGGTGFSAPGA